MDWGIVLLIGVWILNFVISWWNAVVVGKVWAEKDANGFVWLLVWSAAIMSACGFAWCYTILLLLGADATEPAWIPLARGLLEEPRLVELLTPEMVLAGLQLGYLIIIPFVITTGVIIMVHSWIVAWREKNLPSLGIATYNTFAQVHNTYSAMETIPDALRGVGGAFKGRGAAQGFALVLIICLVLLGVVLGIATTWMIVNYYAGREELPDRREAEA